MLALRPDADEALRLAALTHDAEREVAGGESLDRQIRAFDDEATVRAHCERSARVVGEWLRREGADEELVAAVQQLVRLHETGGTPDTDLLQAADSLSFLETNPAARWIDEGRATPERAAEKLHAMCDRIQVAEAREHAERLLERALAAVRSESRLTPAPHNETLSHNVSQVVVPGHARPGIPTEEERRG